MLLLASRLCGGLAVRRPSRKLHPFKLLVMCLYGQYTETVTWPEVQRPRVRIGPMARLLGVSNHRLKEYLSELQRMRYIASLTFEWGYANFRLIPPPSDRLGLREDRD